MLAPARHICFPFCEIWSKLFGEICATTDIAAKQYRVGCTLNSRLGLGVEDKDALDQHSKLSKFGPNSQRGQLIESLSLLTIDEAPMMQRVLFEHVHTILKDLRCPLRQDSCGERPYLGGLVVVFACDYSSRCRSCHLEEQSSYQTETYRSYQSHCLMGCPGNPVHGKR